MERQLAILGHTQPQLEESKREGAFCSYFTIRGDEPDRNREEGPGRGVLLPFLRSPKRGHKFRPLTTSTPGLRPGSPGGIISRRRLQELAARM